MADASLRMMAPLPHVNVHELKKRIEFLYRRHLRAVEDKKAAWWERTSTAMWLAMMEAVREINLPMNLDAVRISRASMLYDTVIYRLNAKFEVRREYGRYRRQAAKRAVRQIRKQQRRAAGRSQRHLAIKEQHDRMSRLQYMAYQAESAFSQMPYQFAAVVKKGAYAARMGLRFLITVTVVAVGISLGVYGYHAVTGKNISDLHPLTVLEHYVWTHPLSLTLLAVPLWILIRRLLFRLGEVDVTPGD